MILRSPAPASELTELRLVSVNVGQPAFLGTFRGKRVSSAIRKQPVLEPQLDLDTLNLAGDHQADLHVHGGADKAAYAHPSEHLERWQAELGLPVPIGFFGENLTTAGAREADVCIGDIWAEFLPGHRQIPAVQSVATLARTRCCPSRGCQVAGRNRSADQTSSMATCRTGCTPRSIIRRATESRFRSVPSLPALG